MSARPHGDAENAARARNASAGRLLDRAAIPRLLLRFAMAGGLLAIVLHSALPSDGQGIVATLRGAWTTSLPVALFWLAVAFAILGVSFAIGAARFQGLMRAAGLDVSWKTVFRAYVVAGFFNLLLPGAILGDVYRFADARGDTGRGAEVFGILVLERLLGLSALGAIGLAAAPAIPRVGIDGGLIAAIFAACVVFAFGTLAALHPAINRALRRGVGALRRLSQRLAEAGDTALAAVGAFSARPRSVTWALLLSLLNQGLPILAIMALAVPLATDVAWYWYAIIVPFVTLMSLLPISIGGTGIRESLYVLLFGAVGMAPASAFALSLSVLAAAMIWAVVGFVVFVLRRGPRPELATRADSTC